MKSQGSSELKWSLIDCLDQLSSKEMHTRQTSPLAAGEIHLRVLQTTWFGSRTETEGMQVPFTYSIVFRSTFPVMLMP